MPSLAYISPNERGQPDHQGQAFQDRRYAPTANVFAYRWRGDGRDILPLIVEGGTGIAGVAVVAGGYLFDDT
jgi:hypothetical protein